MKRERRGEFLLSPCKRCNYRHLESTLKDNEKLSPVRLPHKFKETIYIDSISIFDFCFPQLSRFMLMSTGVLRIDYKSRVFFSIEDQCIGMTKSFNLNNNLFDLELLLGGKNDTVFQHLTDFNFMEKYPSINKLISSSKFKLLEIRLKDDQVLTYRDKYGGEFRPLGMKFDVNILSIDQVLSNIDCSLLLQIHHMNL